MSNVISGSAELPSSFSTPDFTRGCNQAVGYRQPNYDFQHDEHLTTDEFILKPAVNLLDRDWFQKRFFLGMALLN